LSSFQNTQFTLAKIATELEMSKAFLDRLILQHMQGEKLTKEVSMAKYYCCELSQRVTDQCLQFFGGYGMCEGFPISRQYVDTRFMRLMAGASEVQLVIVAKELGL
jgi:acyl-CoA dehydrogenase